jgi:hypothetical protein
LFVGLFGPKQRLTCPWIHITGRTVSASYTDKLNKIGALTSKHLFVSVWFDVLIRIKGIYLITIIENEKNKQTNCVLDSLSLFEGARVGSGLYLLPGL